MQVEEEGSSGGEGGRGDITLTGVCLGAFSEETALEANSNKENSLSKKGEREAKAKPQRKTESLIETEEDDERILQLFFV